MKRPWIVVIIGVSVLLMAGLVVWGAAIQMSSKAESNAHFANVLEQQAILKAGRKLVKAGDLEGALGKFNEALNPKYVESDFDKTEAIASKADLYILWGKYKEALKEDNWVFERTPGHQYSIAKHKEILALIEWEKTKDNQIIYDYIAWLKDHFREQIPPVSYKGYHTTVISTILRLYDTIGDYDAGIAYIDEILAYFKSQDIEKYGEYKPGKVDAEYMKVREAFEAEKRAGGPTCKGQPDCIGDATRALIQSDYFPW